MLTRIVALLKKNAAQLVAVVLVVGVFGFVLPRVADYGEVWSALQDLSTRDLALLAGTAILNVVTFAPPWMAALPGLSFGHAMVMSQASTAASSVMPGGDAIGMALSYSMLRRWGFRVEQVAVATAATAVWNTIANVSFAVVAVGLLALGGQSHALLTTTAAIGGIVLVVGLVAFVLALQDERNARRVGGIAERMANRVLAVLRRKPVMGWADRLVLFRGEAIGLLRRRWHVLTLTTLAGHLAMFLVLVAAVRAVGITADQLTLTEAFAAWALIRIITTIPITPGGLGIVELGLTGALVSFGAGQVEAVTAVLLYRVLTFIPPVAVGGVCLLFWRRVAPSAPDDPESRRVVGTTPDCVERTIVEVPVGCERTAVGIRSRHGGRTMSVGRQDQQQSPASASAGADAATEGRPRAARGGAVHLRTRLPRGHPAGPDGGLRDGRRAVPRRGSRDARLARAAGHGADHHR